MAKLIVGCGYLGLRVARRWKAGGEEVFAVTRSESRAQEFSRLGIQPVVADITNTQSLRNLPNAPTVLFAVGFDRSTGLSIRDVYVKGLRNTLESLRDPPDRFIYISSTGVYGQVDGEWVDENSECRPAREGGQACLDAETLLMDEPVGGNTIILRLAGIYGPGRIPRRRELEKGEPIRVPGDGYLNLIHVDDAVQVVLASESQSAPRTYVVSDGCPVLRRDYFRELARLLGVPEPKIQQPAANSPAAARAATDKRVRNARMQNELGLSLLYPSYREGLAAIVNSERS